MNFLFVTPICHCIFGHGRAISTFDHGWALNIFGQGRAISIFGHMGGPIIFRPGRVKSIFGQGRTINIFDHMRATSIFPSQELEKPLRSVLWYFLGLCFGMKKVHLKYLCNLGGQETQIISIQKNVGSLTIC